MAELKCEVVELEIEDHPNADAIEIAKVRGFQSIVKKGQFKTGDFAVYIPEQSVVPPWVLHRLNMWDDEKGKGGLAGSKGNRVKAIKLRGVLSQGLIFPLISKSPHIEGRERIIVDNDEVAHVVLPGDDVTGILGVEKYEPPIPVHMSGQVVGVHGKTLKYDIENIKNYPAVADALMTFRTHCQITEKVHGTWCCFGIYPEEINPEIPHGRVIVTSKGLSGKGLAFKDVPENENNLYMRMFKKLESDIMKLQMMEPVFILGEIFGKGVQDLQYGLNDIDFRLFDVYVGYPGEGFYIDAIALEDVTQHNSLETVPVLYEGPLTPEVIAEYTDGMDTVTGSHIREGIVIKPLREMDNIYTGRTVLKSVSEKYLSRKNATEYN